jgi:ankyrin repeat protein
MNNNGKTALDIAKEMGNKKMITILSKWIQMPLGVME